MSKKELIMELQEIHRILSLTPQEYADEMNTYFAEYGYKTTAESAWAERTGWIKASIERLLEEV